MIVDNLLNDYIRRNKPNNSTTEESRLFVMPLTTTNTIIISLLPNYIVNDNKVKCFIGLMSNTERNRRIIVEVIAHGCWL